MARIVIKIGGSFITKKGESDSFPSNLKEIREQRYVFVERRRLLRVAEEIARIRSQHQIMLVHGAGPFGHALVERIQNGKAIEIEDVHRSMLILNSMVLDALSSARVPVITRSPFDLAGFSERYMTADLVSAMKGDLVHCLVPVSHGDIIRAPSGGRLGKHEVVSGDVVARDLALGWPADRMIMVTDMDGILDRDPAVGQGRTIPRIAYSHCLSLLKQRSPRGADVTGGIVEKIRNCEEPIARGIPLQIVSGLHRGHLVSASAGGEVGTVIEAR